MTSLTVVRIDLPSGGWWEIETRPRWKHVREWSGGDASGGLGPSSHPSDAELADRALVSMTTGWSFAGPISLESLAVRDEKDVISAMGLLSGEIATLCELCKQRSAGEQLLASLVSGGVPEEFSESHIMAITGWSCRDLQETPLDVVSRMALYLAVRQTREVGGTLEFDGGRP